MKCLSAAVAAVTILFGSIEADASGFGSFAVVQSAPVVAQVPQRFNRRAGRVLGRRAVQAARSSSFVSSSCVSSSCVPIQQVHVPVQQFSTVSHVPQIISQQVAVPKVTYREQVLQQKVLVPEVSYDIQTITSTLSGLSCCQ